MADAISGVQAALIGASGVAFGAVGKGVLDWVLAIGKVRADREARAEGRRDKRHERRDDLQRQTLLDLQEAVAALGRATARGHHHDLVAEDLGGAWGDTLWPEELAEDARETHARLRLLRSRIRDENLRETVGEFSLACADQGMATTREAATLKYADALKASEKVHDLAGQLIREMDDAP